MASPGDILGDLGSRAGILANRLGADAKTLARRQIAAARDQAMGILTPGQAAPTAATATQTAINTAQTAGRALRVFRRGAGALRTAGTLVGGLVSIGPVGWIILLTLFIGLFSVLGFVYSIIGGNPNSESLQAHCKETASSPNTDCTNLTTLVESVCKDRIEDDKQKVVDEKSRLQNLEDCRKQLLEEQSQPGG